MNHLSLRTSLLARHRSRQRQGVVLLIALGMLGLFSILTVTYLVFSSQARNASVAIGTRINDGERPEDLMPQILQQIIVGTNNSRSAANGQGLMEDLYGYDSVRLRVAHYRTDRTNASPAPAAAPPREAFGELFGSLPPGYQPGDAPRSTLFRFPLRFARWNFDGSTNAGSRSALQVPEFALGYQGIPLAGDNPTTATVEPNDARTREQFDDAYTGRIVTFLEGPLNGHSFRVVRSFGRDTNPSYQAGTPESILSHNLVIDLSELPSQTIELGGESFDRWFLADRSPTALLYSSGPDDLPGVANFDDNMNGNVDELAEMGWPNSDDIGYRLVINGQVFNGDGADAAFAGGTSTAVRPGWSPYVNTAAADPPGWSDPDMTALLQPNNRYLGPTSGAQPDEGYDAPDLENMFLAWQPSLRSAGVPIHGAAEADLLINQAIIPSFHRPALFNYLMNQPIDFAGSTTPARTFAQLNLSASEDVTRLQVLVRRLRRACLRPLPFVGNTEDLDGDDEFMDGSLNFTGSNPTPILRLQLNPEPTTAGELNQIRLLARWMVNGPWDVDNDGDGIPDSIWVDFALPSFTTGDGTILRPMVAALIEDMDGRINLNTAGNHGQLSTNFFGLDFSVGPPAYTPSTFRLTARGFGVGPSEVYPGFLFGQRINTPPTNIPSSLSTLFGRVLQSRYGGMGTQLGAPGYDDGPWENDLIGQMIHPARRDVHAANAPMGMPLDMYGRGAVDVDEQGNVVVQNLLTQLATGPDRNERTNEPYQVATEGAPIGNDQPFSADELMAVLQRNNPNRSAFRTRLLDLLDQSLRNNPELERLITTESRSQRMPEMSGYGGTTGSLGSVMDLYVSRLETFMGASNTPAVIEAMENSLTKMLAVEFRKGGKLNLNRPIGNGNDDNSNGVVDDAAETRGFPAAEAAYPPLPNPAGSVLARYVPYDPSAAALNDFGDLSGQELLARHLYVLMFMLLRDPAADSAGATPAEIFPNYPYPSYKLANGTNVPFVADNAVRNRFVARRLAQWAVNVVDFRDANCAMTRFRFDEDPFDANGWDTSGGFETVWGAEPSDLRLTEAIATHDKGTRDTTLDLGEADGPMGPEDKSRTVANPGDTPDADMDQLRMPTASAFVEIQNARPISTGGAYLHYPAELYDFSTAPPRLDLARIAGAGGNRSPVWRLAVGQGITSGDAEKELKSPRWLSDGERLSNNPDDPFTGINFNRFAEEHGHLATFETNSNGLLAFGPDKRQISIDRVVWFTDLDPTTVALPADAPNPAQVFRNIIAAAPNSPPRLEPGGYALVAPRFSTEFGQKDTCVEANNFEYDPSDQKIDLVFDGGTNQWEAHYTDLSGADRTPPYQSDNANYRLREIVPIIAQALPPHVVQVGPGTADWDNYYTNIATTVNERVDFGFNISAPLTGNNYYPAPEYKLNSSGGTDFPRFDSYYDATAPNGAPRDQPVDEISGTGKPLEQRNWLSGGTYQDASTAFLQRLADPTLPYNANSNPYITVDWITMDLSVFSGQQDLDDTVDDDGDGMFDESVDQNAAPGEYVANMEFDTRRKIPDTRRDGAGTVGGARYAHRSIFMTRLNILRGKTAAGANTFFDFDLRNNPAPAAMLNTGIGADMDGQPFPMTFGYVNREFGLPRQVSSPLNYVGMPEQTYMASLPWYDRDFASPYEITMVPACSMARMGVEFDLGTEVDFTVIDPAEDEVVVPFRHLLGFDFGYDSPTNPTNVLGIGPGFEQIFDFIDTGPIYADDERWLDPVQTQATANATFNRVTETLRPPFNHITMHRVPGKVNLNTTPDYLQNNDPNDLTYYDRGEDPRTPEGAGNAIRYSPTPTANTFSGNGAVYQSLAWGFSTAFELDRGEFGLNGGTTIPSASAGTAYASTQDTPFGYNFKGFIESRTGFSQNAPTAAPPGYPASPAYLPPLEDLRNRFVFHTYPSRFAGLFGPASAARLPMLQSYLPKDVSGGPAAVRRTYDVSLMRPHPDLSRRDFATQPPIDDYDMNIDTVGGGATLRSQILSTPLFERSHAELHRDNRLHDRNPMFRMRNTAKLANMTTHHSNVFLVRLTIGYFQVDPQTGEVGAEYGIDTNDNERQQGVFIIDRTIPVAFERGQTHNAMNAVISQSLDQ